MDKENSRNTIVFVICMVVILGLYQIFYLGPAQKRQEEARARAAAAAKAAPGSAAALPSAPVYLSRTQALAATPRARIDTPAVGGSISLKGARLDDLFLKDYRQTIAKNSPPVELFRPDGAQQAYFAEAGWLGAPGSPDANTLWTQTGGSVLSPGRPITLSYDNGRGLTFTRTIAVDDHYMFTVTDTVANHSGAPVALTPYSTVQRQGLPQLTPAIVHEGAIGVIDTGQPILKLITFKNWRKQNFASDSTGGWFGITDKYWLAAVIPGQKERVKSEFKVSHVGDVDVYEADYLAPARTLAPGAQTQETTRVFAGAKKVSVLDGYKQSLGLPRFDDAVDWGMFGFLTKPLFWLLELLHGAVGNFGAAILLLTVIIKLALFPIANRSFEMASKMKKLQPQMQEIRERFKDDPAKQQQETMALYKREKLNPVTGCLPQLATIPVFLALFKVLNVTIEMRQAPFFGWIRDLSAPDPTTFLNLFGLIPWNPALTPMIGSFLDGPLHIGLLPILYGLTFWLTQQMSPQAIQDPSQKLILQFMPIMFTYFFSHTASGLVIYYCLSNLLTILQQYVIMHRTGTENPIDGFFARFSGRRAARSG